MYGHLLTKNDINSRDEKRNTALYYAVENDNIINVEKLLSLGADPNL